MRALFRYFSLTYARRHPFRVLLSFLAVALGVALFVSVDVSHTSTEAAFRRTVDDLSGRAQLQVVRGRMLGVEENVLRKLDAIPGVKSAPVLQATTTLPEWPKAPPLLILGLDFAREASFRLWNVAKGEKPQVNPLVFFLRDAIIVTETFAREHQLRVGSVFPLDTPGGHRKVAVGAIFRDEGPARVFGGSVSVMPLATAQRLFKRQGKVDRIELVVAGDVEAAAARLREALGPDYRVLPPPRQNSFLDEALTRIQALLGISVIALLVGIFIIYNSVSISVVERTREIGTLRALGATKAQVFGVILSEWAVVGLFGSAAGLGLGIGLAHALIEMTTREANQLMMVVGTGAVFVLPRTLAVGMVLGWLTAVLAAFFPARQAMSITPIEMLRQGLYENRPSSGIRTAFWLGALAIGLAIAGVAGPVRFPNIGLFTCVLAFLGAALVLPEITRDLSRVTQPLFRRLFSLAGFLAADNLAKFPQRTALTVTALAGALAMMVASTAMITSIKVHGSRWLDEALPFDCQVTSVNYDASLYTTMPLPAEAVALIAQVPGVDFYYEVRSALQDFGDRDVMIFGVESEKYVRMQALRGGTGFVLPGTLADLVSGAGVIVSENFAQLHSVRKGESVELLTPHGPERFRVLGTYEEYSWPQGSIYMDLAVYRRLWDDPSVSYVEVKFTPSAPKAQTRRAIADRFRGNYSLFVYAVEDLKRVGDDTLDRTLRYTNVQVAVSVLIGFLGIVNTLLISVMRRTREIGLLRAVGMTRAQVSEMILVESVVTALVGGVLGVALGLAGAQWPLMLHVIQISGYGMTLIIPWGTVALALASAVVIGILASVLPGRRAARLNILEAITYE
jgi:putative ABC transport system permease protein